MRKVLLLVVLAVTAFLPAVSGQAAGQDGASVQQQVTQLRNRWLEAERTRKPAVLEQVLAADCVVTTPQGAILDKTEMLKRTGNPSVKFDTLRSSDTHVQVYGDVAILTDHMTVNAHEGGRQIHGQFRFVRIFVKRQGNWRVVMAQGTRLPAAPKPSK
ncbi:MAG: nuclear transport factor 2 family protein [Terriglobia bacterium]